MAFTLTDLRADLDALLATVPDAATWTTALKDGAVREALLLYSLHGPVHEGSVTVASSGHDQSLASLSDLLAIELIAWPWSDGVAMEDRAVRWRRISPTSVRFDRLAPQTGELIRVRYRRAHRVQGLDGAGETTVPDAHRPLLAEGAASAALGLRLRQLSENPALPEEASLRLHELRRLREDAFLTHLAALHNATRSPVWAGVGL